eukprot:751345-Hanusia_phi.AAC.3
MRGRATRRSSFLQRGAPHAAGNVELAPKSIPKNAVIVKVGMERNGEGGEEEGEEATVQAEGRSTSIPLPMLQPSPVAPPDAPLAVEPEEQG